MTIFVHNASECLTDHLSHGDGLICHSLLRGLVDRGHRVFAYTGHDGVADKPPGLIVRGNRHRSPANSLAPWEHAWRAGRWLREVGQREQVDLVWRMHPYNETGCPVVPRTGGRPLVVGPLFYEWPADAVPAGLGRPRLGLGLQPLLAPLARRGWDRTLVAAGLILCATEPQSARIRNRTDAPVATLPVIVEPPADLRDRDYRPAGVNAVHLVLVANLASNKRPDVFCKAVAAVRSAGVAATATVVGDGPDRPALEAWCQSNGLADVVRFSGRVPNADVFRLVAEADLLVSTSYGEPYGRNIVEAMSVGTPAVCHRSGGPGDIIADGVDGVLVDSLDVEAFARRIADVVRSGQLRIMSLSAQAKATEWRCGRVIGRLETLLLSLLERSK
jgi:glycosyltransferase involved in cell wall biosynthesis